MRISPKYRSFTWYYKWLMPLVFGFIVSSLLINKWSEDRSTTYTVPAFSTLTKSSGVISFSDRWRSSGGSITLLPENGQPIHISCSPPFSMSEVACYYQKTDGKLVNIKDKLLLKKATVYWHPDVGKTNIGRLYQLELGNETIFNYAEQSARYLAAFEKGPPNRLPAAIVILLIFLALSVYQFLHGFEPASDQAQT